MREDEEMGVDEEFKEKQSDQEGVYDIEFGEGVSIPGMPPVAESRVPSNPVGNQQPPAAELIRKEQEKE